MNNIHLHIIGSKSFFNLLSELNFNYIISSDKNLKYNNQDSSIRIIFTEKLQLTEVKKYFTQNIPTIFLFNNKDYLIKNKLNFYLMILFLDSILYLYQSMHLWKQD